MAKPKLTEADILFELFLPMMCTERHQALALFKGKVELHMFGGETHRVWNLTGGKPPWIQRGEIDGANLTVEIHADLVKAIVHGEEPDLEAAADQGLVRVGGDPKILKSLDFSLQEATGLVGTMLKR